MPDYPHSFAAPVPVLICLIHVVSSICSHNTMVVKTFSLRHPVRSGTSSPAPEEIHRNAGLFAMRLKRDTKVKF
jgi:hypothetical protein